MDVRHYLVKDEDVSNVLAERGRVVLSGSLPPTYSN